MKLALPIKGVSDVVSSSAQPELTTRRMTNKRGIDCRTKQVRLATRSGLTKFLDAQVNGLKPIRATRTVTFQRKSVTYTDKADATTTPVDLLGSADVSHQMRTDKAGTVASIDTDRQGNLYLINGPTSIGKHNSVMEHQWDIALPVDQETAVVRCLKVGTVPGLDSLGDVVVAGVSEGGKQADAKLWIYKQTSTTNEKGETVQEAVLVSETKPGAYIERAKFRNGLLYTAQNEPDKGRSYVRIYFQLETAAPHLAREWEIPYPVNDIDVRVKDGAVVTAHPQNFDRGIDPRHLSFSPRDLAMEYRVQEHLEDFDKRIWCRFRAKELADALGLVDGDPVPFWPDVGPSGRNLSAISATDATLAPIYIEDGSNGEPCLRFLGGASDLHHYLVSAANVAIQKQYDDQQRSILPAYDTGRYMICLLVRPALGTATQKTIFAQDNEHGASEADTDTLLHNCTTLGSGISAVGNLMSGKLTWYTTTLAATGIGGSVGQSDGATKNLPFSGSFAYSGSNAMALVTIINDGHQASANDKSQHSTWRVNGRPIDRWVNTKSTSKNPVFVGTDATEDAGQEFRGDIVEIIVVRDYPDGVDHTGSGNEHGSPASGNLSMATIAGTYATRTGTAIAVGDTITGSTGNWTMLVGTVVHVGPNGSFTGWLLTGTSVGAGAETMTGPAGTWTGVTLTGGTAGQAFANRHYPREIGTFGSNPVRWFANAANRFNDNEIERIEGMIAGENGIAHLLPTGSAAVLSATGQPNPGEIVTIDGRVYTFRAALTVPTAANEVVIGANVRQTGERLWRAINASGLDGVQYSEDQTQHATVRATEFNDQLVTTYHLKIETRGATAVNVSEAATNHTWNVATTGGLFTTTATSATFMPGHYPHPFGHLYGFPRPDVGALTGVEVESLGFLLNQGEAILARWDPQGKIKWVLTSRLAVAQLGGYNLPASDQKFGGIGRACQWSHYGDAVYSVGDQFSTSPSGAAQTAQIRRVLDTDTGYDVVSTGAWALSSDDLIGNGGETPYLSTYPKIDVDEFDHVYMPYDSPPLANGVMSAVVIRPDGTVAVRWRKNALATNPAGNCIAVDKKQPDYDGDPATRAFAFFIGTRQGYDAGSEVLTQNNIYRVETVTVAHTVGVPPSETRIVAVADGRFRTSFAGGPFVDPAGVGTIPAQCFSSDADNPEGYHSLTSLRGHVYGTDGKSAIDYDGRTDTLTTMSATVGELKPRARQVVAWRDRLIWYRFADSPHEWLMSKSGDARDYDFAPAVVTASQAVLGSQSPRGTGQAPDIVNEIVPYSDDTALFLCASSVWRLDGDPGERGIFSLVSDSTGGTFGGGWCKDENGVVYLFGTRGCIYAYAGRGLTQLSDNSIPERLRVVDFSVSRPKLLWDNDEQGVHVFLTAVDATATDADTEHYFWSRRLEGWYPDKFASDDMQPTATFIGDGALAGERRAVIGCADGFLRAFDSTVDDDDGVAIQQECLVGPMGHEDGEYEARFGALKAVLATAQGGCNYSLYGSSEPDDLGQPVTSGLLDPGRNDTHFVQARGTYVALLISGSERSAIESLSMDATLVGRSMIR